MGRANIYKPTSNDCNVLLTLCSLILTGKHASMCFLRSNFSFASPPSSAFITNSFKSSISLGTEEGWIKSDRVGEVFIFVKTACILPYISELLSCCFMHSLALFTIFFHVCCKSQAHHLRAQINSVLILIRFWYWQWEVNFTQNLHLTCLLRTARTLLCAWGIVEGPHLKEGVQETHKLKYEIIKNKRAQSKFCINYWLGKSSEKFGNLTWRARNVNSIIFSTLIPSNKIS